MLSLARRDNRTTLLWSQRVLIEPVIASRKNL